MVHELSDCTLLGKVLLTLSGRPCRTNNLGIHKQCLCAIFISSRDGTFYGIVYTKVVDFGIFLQVSDCFNLDYGELQVYAKHS